MYEEIEVICKEGSNVFQVFNEGEVFFLEWNYYIESSECTYCLRQLFLRFEHAAKIHLVGEESTSLWLSFSCPERADSTTMFNYIAFLFRDI
jgi:hypothetical protein